MGNVPSGEAGAEGAAGTPGQASATRLYRYLSGTGAGSWELVSSAAAPSLYDAHEDSAAKAPEWHLEVEGPQEAVDTLVDDSFNFEPRECRVTFAASDDIWTLKFGAAPAYERFLQAYNKAMFENRFGVESSEANELKIFGADFMPRLGGESAASRAEWADMEVDAPHPSELRTPVKDRLVADKHSPIHGVVMGAGDRSYLIRDAQIDVMRNVVGGVEDAGLGFRLTPPPARAGSRTPTLTPAKAILMGGETKMNMLTPEHATSLFHADIETGKVVSEWSFQKDGVDVPIKDITTDTKAAQLEDRSTFLGLDANRLARWDLRDPHGVEMASPAALSYVAGKDYARGTKFSCMATSGDGYVVVGSDDGKIRLYSEKTLTQAKTAIPGLGLPITNVAVTYDGKWVLATTRSYLMVLKTTYKDPKSGNELCGFTSRMGANAPAPRLLRLKLEDAGLTRGAPLEKGHFTWVTQRGQQERWIVASCGNYTVLWNFRAVKLAEPDTVSFGGLTTVTSYHLVPKTEHVVDSVFMHDNYARGHGGGDASMVVVTKNRVYTATGDSDSDE
eukprot:scaffold11.g3933.t1